MTEVNDEGFTRLGEDRGGNGRHRVNIIFIHGLGGHPKRTWGNGQPAKPGKKLFSVSSLRKGEPTSIGTEDAVEESTQRKPFWPEEFLALDMPEARIWTYGYRSAVFEGLFRANNLNSASQHGNDLALKFERNIPNNEPVIFIAHSLGHQAIKIYSRADETDSLHGYPTLRCQLAKRGITVTNVLKRLGQQINDCILQGLQPGGEAFALIDENFKTIVLEKNIRIHSFYEARGMPGIKSGIGKVVDDESSKLDLPPDIETIESINADHSQMTKFANRNDEGYRAILNVLKRCVDAELNSVFYVPFPNNATSMVDRPSINDPLKNKLFGSNSFPRAALFGLGGAGKTQIAVHLAYWIKENLPKYSVFWIPAFSDASIERACTEILEECFVQKKEGETSRNALRRYLGSSTSGKWFLIVDNADDITLLDAKPNAQGTTWLPKNDQGRVLLTTRSSQVAFQMTRNASSVLELPTMNLEEATGCLKKWLWRQDLLDNHEVVADLLAVLTMLPLAIRQAADYINMTHSSLSGYLKLFRKTEQDKMGLLSSDSKDDTRYPEGSECQNAVATTWVMSFRQICKEQPLAENLLSFMACIDPDAIPMSILPSTGTTQQLRATLGTLMAFNFLSEREDDETYDMHSLVHLATRAWKEQTNEMSEALGMAVAHVRSILPQANWETRQLWRQYSPHILSIIRQGGEIDKMEVPPRLTSNICYHLGLEGRGAECILILKETLNKRRQAFGEDDKYRLRLERRLGSAHNAEERYEEALRVLEPVEREMKLTLQEDDRYLLQTQRSFATALKSVGRKDEAASRLTHVVAILNRTRPKDDEYLLSCRHELARLYDDVGEMDNAIEVLKEVMAIYKKTVSQDDPNLLAVQRSLAQAYITKGEYEKGIELFERVNKIERETLRDGHPLLLSTVYGLARAHMHVGHVDLAINLLEELGSKHSLANAYLKKNKLREAVELLEQVVALQEDIYPEDHEYRLETELTLAEAYAAQNQPEEAIPLFKHVEVVYSAAGDPSDEKVSRARTTLAFAYAAAGRLAEAMELFSSVVAMKMHLPGEMRSEVWSAQWDLTCLYRVNGQLINGIEVLFEALSSSLMFTTLRDCADHQKPRRLLLGEFQSLYNADQGARKAVQSRIDSLLAKARDYKASGKFDKATNLLRRAVHVGMVIFDADDTRLLDLVEELSLAYEEDGKLDSAIGLLSEVLD
ncbi:kinesin light chain [Fusarium albosuccineum]|uniref:Kinesin light chain n=1 Tax=Fusarium albosuccineum TaxID=1237068 RepID=A0A8H4PKJ8_9HYPO|nr:kinesin light chain [Fusarium albosuccineum]